MSTTSGILARIADRSLRSARFPLWPPERLAGYLRKTLEGLDWKILAAGGMAGICIAYVLIGPTSIACASGATGGLMFAGILQRLQASARRRAREEEVPEALEELAEALRAQGSLRLAIAEVGKSGPPHLAPEFAKIAQLLEAGLPLEDCASRLPDSLPCSNAGALALALRLHLRHGANLAAALEFIATSARQELMVRRELEALTAQSRLSATVLALAPAVFAVFTVALGLGGKTLFESALGLVLMTLGGALELCGFLWTKRICSLRW